MLCANCKKEAQEIQDAEGVVYTKCDTCGWLEYNQTGEAIACEPRPDLLKPLEGEQEERVTDEKVGPDSKSYQFRDLANAKSRSTEPAPDIQPKPKPKPKPKSELPNEADSQVAIHFDDD